MAKSTQQKVYFTPETFLNKAIALKSVTQKLKTNEKAGKQSSRYLRRWYCWRRTLQELTKAAVSSASDQGTATTGTILNLTAGMIVD